MKLSITASKRNRILGVIIWLILWEVAYLIIDQAIYLPSPLHVLKSFITLIRSKDFVRITVMSSYRVIISFIIASISALTLGFICGLKKTLFEIFEPMVILLRSTPVISVIILAIVWLPSNYVPVFSGFLMCFPIIFTNMVMGIRQTDPLLIEMSSVYQVPKFRILKDVYLPSAMSHIKSGLTNALGLSWKVIAAAEVLSLPKYAIGSKLHDTKVYLEISELFAWTMLIILMSSIFDRILEGLFQNSKSIR